MKYIHSEWETMISNSIQVLTFLESWGSSKDLYTYWNVLHLEKYWREKESGLEPDEGKVSTGAVGVTPPNLNYLAV